MSNSTGEDCGLVVGGVSIALDADGHLRDPDQWRPEVAEALAALDGVELGPDHWWLIEFVREHHHSYGTPPLMRVVVSALRQRKAEAGLTSRELYRLFPDNPVRQACRYGGLAKPDWCI
jgi:tRNA 2-thiouridine synthesizing protein E